MSTKRPHILTYGASLLLVFCGLWLSFLHPDVCPEIQEGNTWSMVCGPREKLLLLSLAPIAWLVAALLTGAALLLQYRWRQRPGNHRLLIVALFGISTAVIAWYLIGDNLVFWPE